MGNIISFCYDCRCYSAYTTDWEYLINIVKVINWNLFVWGCWTVKNYVVIIYFDCVRLGINLFWRCSLRWFEFKKLLKIFKAGRKEFFFENSRTDWKSTDISYVVFGEIFVHVFIDSRSINVVRKDWEFSWEDEILLLRCWERSSNWGWCSFSWKSVAQWCDCRNGLFSVDLVSYELSEHDFLIQVWN